MRLDDITNEQFVDEAPVGMLKRAAQGVGSKVLNKIPGAKNKAANLAGKADLSDTANNLYKQFSQFIGTQGKNIGQATGEELDAFLKSKKAIVPGIPSGVLNKKQINDVLMKAAKDAMAKQAGATIAQPQGGGQAPVDANKDGKDDNTGKPIAKAPAPVDANKDGKDDNTGQPIAKAPTAKQAKLSPALKKKIDALNPEQKKQLAELL